MAFNFFKLSERLFDDFKGIKGSTTPEVSFVMKNTEYEEGELRPKTKIVNISRLCLLTDLSNRQKLLYQDYIMKGRKLISIRYIDKHSLFEKNNTLLNITNDCYVMVDNEKYSIIDFISYKNNNMCRFICAYGGEND